MSKPSFDIQKLRRSMIEHALAGVNIDNLVFEFGHAETTPEYHDGLRSFKHMGKNTLTIHYTKKREL